MELKIEREFQEKIPPLTEAEFEQLRENILNDGEVYEPIAVWNGIIVDGHNRWKVIKEHPEIPYKIREMDFTDKWAAFDWMYQKQLGRRNLSDEQKTYLIGKLYESRKKSAGGNGSNQYVKRDEQNAQNGQVAKTDKEKHGVSGEIALELNIGRNTVRRAEHFSKGIDRAAEVDPKFKQEILSGEVKTTKAEVSEIRNLESDEEVKQAIEVIRNPEKKKEAGVSTKEVRDRFAKIRDVARRMGQGHAANTFDDVLTLLNAASDDFIWKLRRTIEGEKDALKKDDRWPDALEGYFDSIIHDIEELKGEIIK